MQFFCVYGTGNTVTVVEVRCTILSLGHQPGPCVWNPGNEAFIPEEAV